MSTPKAPNRPRGLGRGLESLLPGGPASDERNAETSDSTRSYFMCAIERVQPMPGQPRQHFEALALDELAASIRESGVIQPLVVRAKGDHFELIAGERRLRASQLAGLTEVPVVVRDVSARDAFTLALIENVQREDLNAIEEAEAYRHLVEEFGMTHEETSRRVGRSRVSVSNSLRLLQLPARAREAVVNHQISAGHARAILAAHEDWRDWLTGEIIQHEHSVRRAEELARLTLREGFDPHAKKKAEPQAELPPTNNLRDTERRLREALGQRVKIRRLADHSGTIEVHFDNDDTLHALIQILDKQH